MYWDAFWGGGSFAKMLLSISFFWNTFPPPHIPEQIKLKCMKSEILSQERQRHISNFIFNVWNNYRRSYDLQCNTRTEQMLIIFFLFKKNFITLQQHNSYHDYGERIAISYNSQKFFDHNRNPNNIIC